MAEMTWHEGHPKYMIENGEPVEAQAGDEPTHVLMPLGTLAAHEAFYRLAVAERNFYKRGLQPDATMLNQVKAAMGIDS
jgi:hypothetical protein